MEFIRVFNIKNIDWKNFESNVLHVQPYWRQRDLQVPESVTNRYSTKLKTRIQNSKESFDPASITAEFQQFLADGEAAYYSRLLQIAAAQQHEFLFVRLR